jgi:hypothetical protein
MFGKARLFLYLDRLKKMDDGRTAEQHFVGWFKSLKDAVADTIDRRFPSKGTSS